MKELDILLERFLAEQSESLASDGWPVFEEFLAQQDDVLLDWVSGRKLPADQALLNLIDTLIKAA